MKNIFTTAVIFFSITTFAQVGINNTSPKATLDITAKATDGSKPEGLIIPKLSGDNIHTATANAVYGANQKGLIVYASSADTNPTGATANITAAGYYYFDGGTWQRILETSSGDSTNDGWVNDTTNSMIKLGAKADGTARAAATDFVVTDTGNVGIGTISPKGPLNISYNNAISAIANSYLTPGIILTGSTENSSASGPGLYFEGQSNNTGTRVMKLNMTKDSSGDGYLNFQSVTDDASGLVKGIMSISNKGFINMNNLFYVDGINKKVGIGTSAPKSYFHVNTPTAGGTVDAGLFSIDNCGSACSQNTARNIVLNNSNVTNTRFASIDFVPSTDPTAASGASIQGIDRDATNNYAGLSFFTRNATDYNSRMVIKSSGNVGIGTQSPNAKLHTVSSTGYGAFQMQDGSEGTGKFLSSNASGQATWVNSPLTPVIFGTLNTTGATVTDNMYLNSNITLPKGKWLIYVGLLLSGSGGSSPSATNNRWVRLTLGSNNSGTSPTVSGFNFLASSLVSGWLSPITDYYRYTFLSGVIPVEVTNSSSILYLWTKDSRVVGTDPGCVIANNGENYLFAVPAY